MKARIRTARLRAALVVNSELALLSGRIGRDVLRRQGDEGWGGAKVIDRLGEDHSPEFPGVVGFCPWTLNDMRAFAQAWPDEAIVRRLPFSHTSSGWAGRGIHGGTLAVGGWGQRPTIVS